MNNVNTIWKLNKDNGEGIWGGEELVEQAIRHFESLFKAYERDTIT